MYIGHSKKLYSSYFVISMVRIAIMASGNGTNAEKIMQYFAGSERIKVVLVLTNNAQARVLERARRMNVGAVVFDRYDLYESDNVRVLLEDQADIVVLAGFLWKIPASIIRSFPGRIVNIHPALLPAYGGKGMYGMHVHRAVKEAGEDKTGITIHLVNEDYDKGRVIFQTDVSVLPDDTPDDIAAKVHELEYRYFAPQLEKFIVEQMNL